MPSLLPAAPSPWHAWCPGCQRVISSTPAYVEGGPEVQIDGRMHYVAWCSTCRRDVARAAWEELMETVAEAERWARFDDALDLRARRERWDVSESEG